MGQQELLEAMFQYTTDVSVDNLKLQLAFRNMEVLADHCEGWVQDRRISPEQSAQLLGWAESLRRRASNVGPAWNPPTPTTVLLFGFVGRLALHEESPLPTPQLHRRDIKLRTESILASLIQLFSAWRLLLTCGGCKGSSILDLDHARLRQGW